MTTETMDGLMCILLKRETVLGGKSVRVTLDESRVELEEKFREKTLCFICSRLQNFETDCRKEGLMICFCSMH